MDNRNNQPKPELVHKLEGCTDEVNGAVILPGENGVISISNDRSVRLWLLRDSGQFWPSICHYMTTAATSLSYCHQKRKLFVGLESGAVEEFTVARDYNRMDSERLYHAHTARVTDTVYTEGTNWVLTSGRDKYFQFHCTTTGKRLGGYLCNAWCTTIAYDEEAQYVFIGDYSGAITVCKLEQSGVNFINTLKVRGRRERRSLMTDDVSGSQREYPLPGLGRGEELVVLRQLRQLRVCLGYRREARHGV